MSYKAWIDNLKSFTKNFDRSTGDRLIVANALLDTQPEKFDAQPEKLTDAPSFGASKLNMAEIRECHAGRKISAIKLVRERTGFGLKESKEMVDDWCRDAGAFMPSTSPWPMP